MYCHEKINQFLDTCSDIDMARIILKVIPDKTSQNVNLLADILFRFRNQDFENMIGVFLNNRISIHTLGRALQDMGVDVEGSKYTQVTSTRGHQYIIPSYCTTNWTDWCASGNICKPSWAIPIEEVQEMHKSIKGATK